MTNDARKTKAELIEELAHLRKMVRQDPARHLFDSAPLPYQSLDEQGRLVEVNQAWLDMMGYREDEVLGRWIGEFMTQASRDFTARNYPVFLEHGEARELEFTYIKRDGTRIEVSLDSRLERGPDGPRTHTILHDVTEKLRARENLADSERRFRGLFESNADGIVYANTSGTILNVNPALCLMLGYGEDELLGKHVLDIMPEEEGETERAFFRQQIFEDGRCVNFQEKFLHADGRLVPISVRAWANMDETGAPQGVWALIRDLSDALEAEARVARSRELYRLLAENSEDIIWTMDNDLNYTYISPAVQDLRGVRPEDLIGRNALDSMTPESKAQASKWYWKIIAEESGGKEVEPQMLEAELYSADGSTVWTEIQLRIMRNQDGARVGFLGTTRNISERKRMELRLRDSERSLRAMLEATHDAVGLFSKEGKVLVINRNMASLLGPGATARGRDETFAASLPREVADKWMEALGRTVDTGRATSIQNVHKGRVIDTVIYPVPDETGHIAKVAAYARDVTERIQADQALKQSEAQYRRIVETVNEGIVGLDADQRVTFVNQRTADFLGYSAGEMLGRPIGDFLVPDEREAQERQFRRRVKGVHDRYERRFVRKGGEIVWGLVSAAPIMGEDGDFLGVFSMVANITKFKQAEERIRESEARYRNIFENSVEGLYQSTPEGQFISLNPAMAHILGYETPEEVMATVTDIPSQLFADPADREKLERLLREKGVVHELEVLLRRRDGQPLWISENAREVRDEDGRPIMFEGSVVDISERKRTEEALRLTQFSVDYSPVAIYWTDEQGRLYYVNESASKSLGYTNEELLQLTIPDIDVDMTPEGWADYWQERSTGSLRHFETRHRRKDGTTIPVGITSHFKRYGDMEYLFAYAYDLTERERADEALRRSQALLNEVQRVSQTGGWEVDMVAGTAQWTEGQYRLYGLSPADPPPRPDEFIETYVHPDDREMLWEKTQLLIQEKVAVDLEYRTLLPDGKEGVMVGVAIPETDEMGRVVRLFGSSRDVTMERQAARALQLSHERLLNILDGIDADIYVSSMEQHEILFMNAHMRESFGDPQEGIPCREFFKGDSEQCPPCPKPDLLDKNGNPVETIVREWHNPLTNRWYLNHDRAIRWLEGEVVHMHMAADITEIKVMSESLRVAMAEAEAANLAKNEFLANMSHEIRTPLNGLLGMLQLLQLTELVEEQREFLDTATNSGRNLLQILNDILDLSKVESGKLELEASTFELGEVLESVVSMFRHQVESRGLKISWRIDEDLPRHFVADKGRLRQILFNLVGNASKFTESGRIEVEAYPLAQPSLDGKTRIFFSVTDTGIGIPDEKVDSVFDPFTQVDGSSTRKYQGTGLGLGIVRRLVMLMGGNVSMTSLEGKGTIVAFTVLAEEADRTGITPTLMGAFHENVRFSVLVAEDERVNQTVVKRLLGKLGHEVVCVETGEEALKVLRGRAFDCILMDIQMPGLDGMETTRIIREKLRLSVPIIALTAHAMKGDRDRFLEAGMTGYVAKPFDLAELEAELRRVMVSGKA